MLRNRRERLNANCGRIMDVSHALLTQPGSRMAQLMNAQVNPMVVCNDATLEDCAMQYIQSPFDDRFGLLGACAPLRSPAPPTAVYPPVSNIGEGALSNNNNYINTTCNKLQQLLKKNSMRSLNAMNSFEFNTSNGSSASVRVCARCGEQVNERTVHKVADQVYHAACIRCSECSASLRDKCFVKDGKLFCSADYFRRFGTKCALCKEGIVPCELVQKAHANVYHLKCFQCKCCQKTFEPGEEYYLLNDARLLCKTDYDAARAKEAADDSGNKRPRTIITAKQLASLKRIYNESPKPARHVREQLSLETDLEMRVVQVWFQNRRAKEKRMKKDLSKRKSWVDSHNRSNGSSVSLKDTLTSENSQMSHRIDIKDDDIDCKDEDDDEISASISETGCQYSSQQESVPEMPSYKRCHSEFFDSLRDAQQIIL